MHLRLSIHALLATATAVCSAAPYVFLVEPSSPSAEAFSLINKERGTAFLQYETTNRDSKDKLSHASLIGDSLNVESSSSDNSFKTASADRMELRQELIDATTMVKPEKREESMDMVPKDLPSLSDKGSKSGADPTSGGGTVHYSNKCSRCDFIKRFLGLGSKLMSKIEASNTAAKIHVSNKGRYDVIKRFFRRQDPAQPAPTVSNPYATNRCGRCGVIKRFFGLGPATEPSNSASTTYVSNKSGRLGVIRRFLGWETSAKPSNSAPTTYVSNKSGRLGVIKRLSSQEPSDEPSNSAPTYHYSNKSGRLGVIKRTFLALKSVVEPSTAIPTIHVANKCGGFCGVIKRAIMAPSAQEARRLHPHIRPTF